ncbi:hypothetical protein B566_EDAN019365 [Ephemera danica]|nr:hypothetical protein B566_EDAN019365 [Ephemera danica]
MEIATDEAAKFVCGDPTLETTTLGPMAFAQHRDRVRQYIDVGQAEGARLVTGGAQMPAGLEKGYFVQPTIFANVLSVLRCKDEAEGVAMANDTIYGLNGAVWSGDMERAVRVARQLRCGKVDINGGGFNLNAPAGGRGAFAAVRRGSH